MIYETTITILPEEENNKTLIENKILKQLSIKNKSSVNAFVLKKKSIDARKGKIKFHLKYSVYVGENPEQEKFIPKWKTVNSNKKVDNKQLTKLDSAGSPVETALNDTVMNVYGALLIDILEFRRLNPKFKPEDYI